MGRLSRGCLRCRQRRVRCDEGRPSCRHCIHRNEVCEGYRDESSLVFRHETDRVIERSRAIQVVSTRARASKDPPHSAARERSKSAGPSSAHPLSASLVSGATVDTSEVHPNETSCVKLSDRYPWMLKEPPVGLQPPIEEQIVDQFMDKYVIYPCNLNSSPGFLEHLPCMFKEVNVKGRYALRWAVQAVAYADVSKYQESNALATKALEYYGMALGAFGESLSTPGKVPDDYDLMTVVVLDIFETLFTPEEVRKGSHIQGMAQMLRLQSSDMLYNTRGWSLFRLAHHRIQKQQLAYNMPEIPETSDWLSQLNDSEPYVRLEKNAHDISETCRRARSLLDLINARGISTSTLVHMIKELYSLDQVAVSWRQTPHWSFTNLAVSDRPDLLPAARGITDIIQLHPDVWMAYEWNYHRTARIIFLQQILKCCNATLEASDLKEADEQTLNETVTECVSTIQWLADEFLATVPQSFGNIDHMGRLHDNKSGPPRCRGVGGYLLLWPTRTVKAEGSATSQEQKERACRVFEQIREYTGMKDLLGYKSNV